MRAAWDAFLGARSSAPAVAGSHADLEAQSWNHAAVAGQGLGRPPGPLGCCPGHGLGVCGPRERRAGRPSGSRPLCFALRCVSCLSPGGLQPFEAQSDHGRPAEHAAQVQGLHAFGHIERHAGQNILCDGNEGCQAGRPRDSPSQSRGSVRTQRSPVSAALPAGL